MAKNKLRWLALGLAALAVFVAGGWFFTSLPRWRAPQGEVEEMYSQDGASLGIFDNIPPEDLAAAEAVAAYGLNQQVALPEEQTPDQNGAALPSQISLTDAKDIAGFAPVEKETEETGVMVLPVKPAELNLTGNETVGSVPGDQQETAAEEDSKIAMIDAPVKYFLIKNLDEYKKFKTRARGSYPDVNFKKQMIVVLESDSNLPDNIFEIDSAAPQDGKLIVKYRVNVFDLDKKINTHTVLPVDKTNTPVELKQVL